MWAQVLTGPRDYQLRDVPPPAAADLDPGDALLRFGAGAICGSDLPYFRGDDVDDLRFGHPGFPVHEVTGTVVSAGDTDLRAGQRVVGWARDSSGLTEYCAVKAAQVCVAEDTFPDVQTTIIQPLACIVYALDQLDVRGRRVAVFGLGPIGLLFSHVSKTRGAAEVIGIDPVDRADVGATFGVDTLFRGTSHDWVTAAGRDEADVVIEAVGHQVQTINDAIEAAGTRATIYSFGVPDHPVYPVAYQRLFRKNITLKGGVTFERRACLEAARDYLGTFPGLAEAFFTNEFSAADATAAFETAVVPKAGQLKVGLQAL